MPDTIHNQTVMYQPSCYLSVNARVRCTQPAFRLDKHGHPWVLEINSVASLGAGGPYVRSAAQAGFEFGSLLMRILEIARAATN